MTELTAAQKERIDYLATDAWVVDSGRDDDGAQSMANFRSALEQMSSVEVHHFACNFNWDCGTKELAAVVDHPNCDAGTAMMIFWLAQPAYYYRKHQLGDLAEHEQPVFQFLHRIADRLLASDFAHSEIACDPSNRV